MSLLGTKGSKFLHLMHQFCLGTLLLALWVGDLCSSIGPTFGFMLCCCHLELVSNI